MNNKFKNKVQIFLLGFVILYIVIFTGCVGVSSKYELAARKETEYFKKSYRPEGRKALLPVLTTNSPLKDFILYGVLNSPDVESTYYKWLELVEKITIERSLPDPRLNFQFDVTDTLASFMPGLMQEVPGDKKLLLRSQIASEQSRREYHNFEASVISTAGNVRKYYYQLFFLQEKIRISTTILDVMKEIENIARLKNESGTSTIQDVLKAQIEVERLKTEILNLKDSQEPLRAQFKSALGIGAFDPEPPIPARFETTPFSFTYDELLNWTLARNPALKSLEAEIKEAEAAIKLAVKSKVPDFSGGIEVDFLSSPLMYRPQFGLTLPIWKDKISAQIESAVLRKKETEARLSSQQIRLAVDVAEKAYVFREANRTIELIQNSLLPLAKQSLDVAVANYTTGKIDFLALLEAWRTVFTLELELLNARTARELAIVDLSTLAVFQPAKELIK